MTRSLDYFLAKWTFYKRCLVIFLAFNIFSIAVSAVLGFNYFTFKRNLGAKQQASLERIEKSDLALNKLAVFQAELSERQHLIIRNREDEKKVLTILNNWQEIKVIITSLNTTPNDIPLSDDFSTLAQVSKSLNALKQKELSALRAELTNYNDTTRLLIIAGALTLIFGIILPHLVLFMLARTLNRIRVEMQNAALEFIKNWSTTKASFGDEPFKNVKFWLQILLLAGHQAGKLSSHPAIQVTSELAYLVHLELHKKSTGKAAA
ncbi:MAG: hypothetical protein A2Z20_07715 [Bdellovibrionales bacterium RBG_16_40_8]|nr:MAG: hypothetical protein A2Z20_07715 [Bdellovibrionales bacterium RBG_16_40_8]